LGAFSKGKHRPTYQRDRTDFENGGENMSIKKIIEEFENPYPKDIFTWDSKEKLDFNRGRFHKHCFEIVENMRKKLLEMLEEENEKEIEMLSDLEKKINKQKIELLECKDIRFSSQVAYRDGLDFVLELIEKIKKEEVRK
jgi:hypothetical protein